MYGSVHLSIMDPATRQQIEAAREQVRKSRELSAQSRDSLEQLGRDLQRSNGKAQTFDKYDLRPPN
jgi:hypothetical protein